MEARFQKRGEGMISQPQVYPKRSKKLTIGLIFTIATILAFICITMGAGIILVRSSFHSYIVTGSSMEPGLHNGQVVLARPLPYTFSKPSRGDLVIFHQPLVSTNVCPLFFPTGSLLIQRIIGIPGDTISVTATSVILNGGLLNESYLAPFTRGVNENGTTMPSITLGSGQYFLLADNRPISADSRCYGPVPFQNIVGKVIFTLR